MGEAIISWLVFYEQGSLQISHRTPDEEPGGHGLVLHEPSCHRAYRGHSLGLFCLSLHYAPSLFLK